MPLTVPTVPMIGNRKWLVQQLSRGQNSKLTFGFIQGNYIHRIFYLPRFDGKWQTVGTWEMARPED
jgi:hypothetical protein